MPIYDNHCHKLIVDLMLPHDVNIEPDSITFSVGIVKIKEFITA